jgi:TATA-binding protein-associated factor Taf7
VRQDLSYADFFDPPSRAVRKKAASEKRRSKAPSEISSAPSDRKVRFMDNVKVKEIPPRRLTKLEKEALASGKSLEDLEKGSLLSELLDGYDEDDEDSQEGEEEEEDDEGEEEDEDDEEEEEEDDDDDDQEDETQYRGETIERLKGDLFAGADDDNAESADGS